MKNRFILPLIIGISAMTLAGCTISFEKDSPKEPTIDIAKSPDALTEKKTETHSKSYRAIDLPTTSKRGEDSNSYEPTPSLKEFDAYIGAWENVDNSLDELVVEFANYDSASYRIDRYVTYTAGGQVERSLEMSAIFDFEPNFVGSSDDPSAYDSTVFFGHSGTKTPEPMISLRTADGKESYYVKK